nr:MAG TPA: hypothetical protein [Caudoviricetes sp.]
MFVLQKEIIYLPMLTLSDQHYILSYIGSKLKILFTYQIVTK